MEVIKTKFEGLSLIKLDVFKDERGKFYEHWQKNQYIQEGIPVDFVQDDLSFSKKNVLRGLHGQKDQCKLIEVIEGKIWDVLVDVRPNSPTFKQYFSIYLSGEEPIQVFAPDGFVHGFYVLSDRAIMHYKCSTFYDKSLEYGYRYDDPTFSIAWPSLPFILSEKDKNHPLFK